MKARQFARVYQARHDHFNIGIGCVVAQIDQTARLGSQALRRQQTRTQVLDHSSLHGGLEQLVFEEHVLIVRKSITDLPGTNQIALECAAQMTLAGKVSAIANPHSQGLTAELLANVDALQGVRDRLGTHARVGVRQATKFV